MEEWRKLTNWSQYVTNACFSVRVNSNMKSSGNLGGYQCRQGTRLQVDFREDRDGP
jgi:hypothetical protein